MRIETATPAATEAAGADLAASLSRGDIVAVSGELGSGKTTFVRGACRALGVEDAVTSPTFTIGQLYRGRDRQGPLEVAHVDLYRLPDLPLEDAALLDDYLTPDRIAFIEWPGAAEPQLQRIAARVTIRHLDGDRRVVEVA